MLRSRIYAGFAIALGLGLASYAGAQGLPFGGPADVDYSKKLWTALVKAELVGRDAIGAHPYEGAPPHGNILITLEHQVTVDGRKGVVIVKKNYGGEDASIQSVGTNPRLGLNAVTVMFKREKGYDPKGKDWFWVKYKPDGSLHNNPKGMKMAGRISPNETDGCKACHRAAPGEDFLFLHDRLAR